MPIKPIKLEQLKQNAETLYESVIVSALEARRINEDNKLEFNALMNTFVPSTDEEFEERDNAEQEKISVEFEKREKPHLIALKKLLNGEIKYRFNDAE